MRPLFVCLTLHALAAGCSKPAEEAKSPPKADATKPDAPTAEPADPNGVNLPTLVGARPLDGRETHAIYLNVNTQGKVLLAESDRYKDTEGNEVGTLDNAEQVRRFLTARAKEDRAAAGPGRRDAPPRSTLVLRADAKLPYEKLYGIMKAAQAAGYRRVEWRAKLPTGGEGQLRLTLPITPEEGGPAVALPNLASPSDHYASRVTADAAGKVAKITFRKVNGDSVVLGTTPEALEKKLKEVAKEYKLVPPPEPKPEPKTEPKSEPKFDPEKIVVATAPRDEEPDLNLVAEPPIIFTLQIDEKLLHAEVIRLIDVAVGLGFPDVRTMPLDPKKR